MDRSLRTGKVVLLGESVIGLVSFKHSKMIAAKNDREM